MAHAWATGKLYGLEFGPRFGQRLWSWPKSSFPTAGRIASGRGHRARASTARREVWWDHELLGGDDYRQRISKLLERTQASIVIWSRRSVDSQWMMSEAAAARERKVLVPVTIDGAEPPTTSAGCTRRNSSPGVRATGFLPRCSGRSLSFNREIDYRDADVQRAGTVARLARRTTQAWYADFREPAVPLHRPRLRLLPAQPPADLFLPHRRRRTALRRPPPPLSPCRLGSLISGRC